MKKIFNNDWDMYLGDEFKKDYYKNIRMVLKNDYATKLVYPKMEQIFNALHTTSFEDVKVVILGQDPYHNKNEANGLAFSVNDGIKIPPSLQNIYKELHTDLNIEIPSTGNLTKWAENGVLLLNTSLTVIQNEPNSHSNIGWSIFTDKVISVLNESKNNIVFILWGYNARKKTSLLSNESNLIIESPHPSPLSAYRGFFGSKPFSRANDFLIKNNLNPINWTI